MIWSCATVIERLERRLDIWREKMEAAGLKENRASASSWRQRKHRDEEVW